MKNNIPKELYNAAGIYEIRNLVNGKVYIGSAIRFKPRFNGHKSQLRRQTHVNKGLQNAYYRDGENSFHFNILQIIEPLANEPVETLKTRLLEVEFENIQKFKSTERLNGYNLQKDPRQPSYGYGNMPNEPELYVVDKSTIINLRFGEYNNMSKLTEAQVKLIRIYLIKGRSMGEVARYFSVTRSCINFIKRRKCWVGIEPTQDEIDTIQLPEFSRFKGKRIGEAEVRQIKYLHQKGASLTSIGRYFGRHSARDIVSGRSQGHIDLSENDIAILEKSPLWADFQNTIPQKEKIPVTKPRKQKKGWHVKGEKCRFSKLTESVVIEIIESLKNGVDTYECAKKYNLTYQCIHGINTGFTWRHLTGLGEGEYIRKPTPAIGEKASMTKLTATHVRQIKNDLSKGIQPVEIAKQFPFINPRTIYNIKHEQTWRHISI
ncbi:GIY-YIG nuclease family protein [Spirosoma arboris]|nr:GIY-YIG nuclease family protein [Spirosoma arboris]